jgi:hypothetical protein
MSIKNNTWHEGGTILVRIGRDKSEAFAPDGSPLVFLRDNAFDFQGVMDYAAEHAASLTVVGEGDVRVEDGYSFAVRLPDDEGGPRQNL